MATIAEKSQQNQPLYEAKWTTAARKAYLNDHPENFAGDDGSFPIRDLSDVGDAWDLAGHAANPDEVRTKIKSIAKRLGLSKGLPDTATEKPKEAVVFKPKTKIATLKTCWLEDDAISLNGRQYPREAVDTLIRSAQLKISDPNGLPITCYLSHDKADQDSTRDIVGKATNVWREGARAYATIDIPDTVAGRDFATLVAGKYIRSQSLRASNAIMKVDPNKSFPQVTGASLTLEGIDCTTTPGLPHVARIEDIVTESHSPQDIQEIFNAHTNDMTLEEIHEMPDQITEETIAPITSGTTDGVTDGDPRDDYSKRMYKMPEDAPNDQFPQGLALNDVHDRLAYVMGISCGPETMEAVKRFGTSVVIEREKLQEAGAKLSTSTKSHLMKAHDGVAGHLGMPCVGDGDNDADDKEPLGSGFSGASMSSDDGNSMSGNDKEQHQLTKSDIQTLLREELRSLHQPIQQSQPQTQVQTQQKKEVKKPMTQEEAIQLLAKSGFDIKPPKSKDEILQEQLDAKLAEQRIRLEEQQAAIKAQMEQQQAVMNAHMEDMKKLLTERANPFMASQTQRKSLVEGATTQEVKKPYYRNGDYMREKLSDPSVRERLLDRSFPIPTDMNIEHLLRELQWEYLGMYDAAYGLEGNPKIFQH